MPTVRKYEPQERVTALPGARLTAAPGPEALGSDLGKLAGGFGAQLYQDEMARQDQVAFLEADRKMSEWENQILYDPKQGALQRRGKDAFGAPDEVDKSFTEHSTKVRDELANERQRVAFDRAAAARRKSVADTMARHVLVESRKFEEEETTNYVKNAVQAAINNYDDPARVALETGRAKAAVTGFARRNGKGDEYVTQTVAQIVSNTHVGIIDRYLANGQDRAAKTYYDDIKKEIAGDDIAKVEGKVKVATIEGAGQRGSVEIWGKLGPKGDLDAANVDTMIEEARKKYGDDPLVFKSVSEHIKERANVHNAAQRERMEANGSTVWGRVEEGATLGQIRAMPEFLALPGKQREEIKQHMLANARRKSDIDGDDALYYQRITEASSTALQETFMQHNLMEDRAKLSRAQFNHLVEVQASLRKGDTKNADKLLASERQQARMVDEALIGLKLDPTPNEKTPPAKVKEIVDFRKAVRESVRSLEAQQGKNATDEQVQSIVDGLVIKGVTKPGFIFDDTKRVYQLAPGESIKINAADVPKGEREKIEAALRRQGRAVTDEAVTTLYTAKLLRLRSAGVR